MAKSNKQPTERQLDEVVTSSKVISDEQMTTLKSLTTMSAQIRYLDSQAFTRGQISKILSDLHGKLVRYQWVRNVLITPIKKAKA